MTYLYMRNICNPELSKRRTKMQNACVAQRCSLCMLTEPARSWHVAAEQERDSYTCTHPGKLSRTLMNVACVLGIWIQLLAWPMPLAESPDTFFSYWSTQNFWLKWRTLLLLSFWHMSLWQSHCSQILLVLPSVNTTLTRETIALG